ncbi:hypothetical protein BAY60_15280 [Prauserella muralis]|uniref:Uncharacterized protein n=2 Tax=Prauserella muralis TaxID=588067 RepID=A0A2V4B112_9PSEU|nr:hypothetical protein BAY60_15280 [Prauserella muralis]
MPAAARPETGRPKSGPSVLVGGLPDALSVRRPPRGVTDVVVITSCAAGLGRDSVAAAPSTIDLSRW